MSPGYEDKHVFNWNSGYQIVNQVPRARIHLLVGGLVGSLLEVGACIFFRCISDAPICV